ncbi:hypothetical protein A33M_2927 [Rhodovulum sp. PH10]|nr:hypothetical protein A33M_2927 [Rhodovulum sp. PH10]
MFLLGHVRGCRPGAGSGRPVAPTGRRGRGGIVIPTATESDLVLRSTPQECVSKGEATVRTSSFETAASRPLRMRSSFPAAGISSPRRGRCRRPGPLG